MTGASPRTTASVLAAIPRAAYLACSWTWCIGMYLPVILMREFGIAGWVAFAIPNVVGAAALPFLLRTPEASERYVALHAGAMRWFSAMTIAFHAMFLAWASSPTLGFAALEFAGDELPGAARAGAYHCVGPVFACIALWVAFSLSRRMHAWWLKAAPFCWLISFALLATIFAAGGLATPRAGSGRMVDVVSLAPIIAFGFILCPYLDLTFHRIRRASDQPVAAPSFVVGFGVAFLVMIVGSLAYSPRVLSEPPGAPRLMHLSAALVLGHFVLQTVFTVGAHAHELRGLLGVRSRRWMVIPAVAGVVASIGSHFVPVVLRAMTGDALVYLAFLGLYAVAFPAYVWITARRHAASGAPAFPPAARAVWVATTLLTAPMLWLGFVEHRWLWLAPAAVLALLSRPVAGVLSRARKPR